MFFILVTLNLILYIVTGVSIYKGDITMALVYGGIALVLSLLTINFYRNKRKRYRAKQRVKQGESNISSCTECFEFGCDMDSKDGVDCIDIECGKFDIFECDCGGGDCGGFDCNCN